MSPNMQLSRIFIVSAVAATVISVACGDSTSPTTTGIGTAGGTATSTNNAATVVIPAGALASNTTVTVAPASSPPANPGLIAGSAFEFGPTGTTFSSPVTITIKYDPANLPANVAESSLKLYTATGSDWTAVSGSTVDVTAHTVSGATTHFSTYAPVGVPTNAPVATITITPATPSVAIGATTQLAATTKDANGNTLTGRTVTWTSSDATKATVSATGLVTGVAVGTTTITATSEGKTGTTTVTVTPVPVATVTVTPNPAFVFTGKAIQLTVTTKDANGTTLTGRTITWSTSDATKATVNATGGVTGVATGTVTITATSEGKTGTSAVTVALDPVVTVTISSAVTNLAVGGTATLTATTANDGGVTLTGRAVTWTSSDPSKATISAAGVVTAIAVGSTTITATSEGITGTATVNVTAAAGSVTIPTQLQAISVSEYHGCALDASGAAYCWGAGGNGLGDGTNTDRPAPTAVLGGLTFASISTDELLACGITTINQLYCWGGGSQFTASKTPAAVAPGIKFANVTAGSDHTCGVATDGTGYCAGINTQGRLGTGQSQAALPASSTFLPVAGGLKFKQISVGNVTTCGISAPDGALYCWGNISSDNNGAGAVSTSATPVLITNAVAFASLIPHIENGFVCGLTAAGVATCIGTDLTSYGATTSTSYAQPRVIGGTKTFKSFTGNVCGIGSDDKLYCWGTNGVGQLGQGSTQPSTSATPVLVMGAKTFSSVDASPQGTICAVASDGAGYCWGYNFSGQVGDGTKQNKSTPTLIQGGLTFRTP